MFVDNVTVKLQAGDGGDGAVSFRHEKFVDKGGPDGGDGGNGGNIVLKASFNQNTLSKYRYSKQLLAESGDSGTFRRRHGKNAPELILDVPVGTVVLDTDGKEIADLMEDEQTVIIARGGKGGYGNAHFVSSTRQAPRVSEKGEPGDQLEVTLELKMIADIGLVGLPNAGKSTLLSVVSNARPEIANYPFTTLTPNLGVVDIDSETSLLFADIPGLIAGASEGKGLGDDFLRHIERTSVLVHLIDAYTEDLKDAYKTVIGELKAYKKDLSKLPQIVALTKIEGLDEEMVTARIAELRAFVPAKTKIVAISSQSGAGLKALLFDIKKLADKVKKVREGIASKEVPVITYEPKPDDWHVTKTDKGFILSGNKIERFALRTKFGDFHAEQRLRDIMRKMGILRELQRQGIQPGQQIAFKRSKEYLEY